MTKVMALQIACCMAALALVSSSAAFGDNSLWYRGFFDGRMEIEGSGPTPGYHYYPSGGSTFPLNEQRYSYPLPCEKCSHHHRAGSWCAFCGKVCDGSGAHVRSDHVYQPYNRLPGAYFYKRQPHFNFRSPINVGWPYVKYDQRW